MGSSDVDGESHILRRRRRRRDQRSRSRDTCIYATQDVRKGISTNLQKAKDGKGRDGKGGKEGGERTCRVVPFCGSR